MQIKLLALVLIGLALGAVIFMVGFTFGLVLLEWLYPRKEHPRYKKHTKENN